jgi:hypothetical protein
MLFVSSPLSVFLSVKVAHDGSYGRHHNSVYILEML